MKKIISAIVSLMMLLNIMYIPSVANAANSTIPFDPNKANLSFVYLGSGATPEATAMDFPSTGPAPGEQIWIGVQFSNMSKLRDLFKSNQTGTAESGLNNMTLGVIYDSDILEPVITSAAKLLGYVSGKYPYDSDNDEALYKYSGINRAGTNGLGSDSEPNAIQGTAKSYTENFGVNTDAALYADGGDSAPRVFQDNVEPFATSTVGDDPVIYGFFSFKVKSDATITPGSTVLQAGLGQNIFSMGLGSTGEGDGMALAWNKNESTDTATNLKNYFNITDKDGNPTDPKINLWPTTYTIEFYNSYDPDTKTYGTQLTGKDITGIKEGDTVAKTTDAKMPDDSDFTNDDTTKYLSKPLKYIGADGQAYDFDPDNTVLNSTLFASDANDKTTLKVFAEWADGHTVTFDSNYPSGVTTPTATTKPVTVSPAAGTTFDTTDEPTVGSSGTEDFAVPTGYSFKEWNTQPDGNGTTIVFGTGGTDISAVNTVYAIWSQDWKIEFQKVEGSVEAGNVLDTEYMSPTATDKTVLAPSDPSRTGYKFNGWYYYNGGTKTTFVPKGESGATVISGNTTIYADWIKQVTVKYYDTKANAQANGATGLLASETVDENTLYSALTQKPTTTDDDATHTKQYFEGWYNVTGDTKVDFSSATGKVTDDLIVYQNWENFYKLEFYKEASDIGTTVYDTKYVNPNKATTLAALPTPPTKDNFGFNKWLINGTSTEFTTSTTLSGNMVLVADWTAKITITFHSNDGSPETKSDPIQITPNVNFDGTAPTYTRSGYTFKEWNTESNGSGTAYASLTSAQFSASDELYAIWTADGPNTSTLTFDANLTGVTPNPSSVTVNTGDKVYTANIPVVSKDNYKFDGWYESASITDTTKIDFDAGYTVSEKKTVYAHWTYTGTDKITVTFMNDSTQHATIDVAPNTTLGDSMPADPTKSGYTFKEWNTASNGTGTTFDKNTNVGTTGPATVTVYAQYVQDITVTYDTNGGNNDGPGTVKKPAGDTYVDPTTLPTRAGYTFIGWNTKQNGSGTYVKAANVATYAAVSALFDGSPSTVQLYAQWAAVPDTPNDKGKVETDTPTDPDPAKQGVKVTFDSNALGSASQAGIKDASPKYKYPQYGDTIGTDNMPEKPERPNYKFKGWNTKADGSGVTVDGTIAIGANLGDAIKAIENTTTAYEVTLYAQWQVAPDYLGDKVTVTFNKNTDGKGTDAAPTSIEIVKGDSLGYLPTDPTNGDFSFDGWFTGSANANGKIEFTGNKLTATTPINDTTTYYAQWSKMLVARMQKNTAEYTGQAINPLFDIYEISYPDTQQPYELGKQIASDIDPTTNPDYKITYYKGDPSVTEVKDVGTYTFKVDLEDTSALAIAGASIAVTDYEKNNNRTSIFTVTPKLLTVKVNPDTQIQKAGTTVPLADVKIEGLAITDAEANVIEKKYYKWNPVDNSDTAIDPGELAVDTAPTAIAKYVLQVTVKSDNKNYKIDKVVSSKDGTPVLLYEKNATSTYPAFNILSSDNNIVPGTNIVYVIQANDPSASISVKPGNNTGLGSELSLYDTDYTTSVTFDDAEHPTRSDYYTRVSKDTDYVEFTVTPKNATTILTAPTAGTGVTITGPDQITGAYKVKVDLTKSGATPNDIKITTKAGTDTNAPTLDYNFHIQKLVEAKIVLNYGNSPYGEIMKADNIVEADKQDAKNAFDASDTAHGNLQFGTGYIPTLGITNVKYTTVAWDSYTKNYDKDDNAIFVYEASTFVEPGLKIYDELGAEVTNATYDRTLVVKKMSVGEPKYSDTLTDLDLSVSKGNNDTVFSLVGNIIRPDVYTMTYTYQYTDLNGIQQTLTDTRPVIVLSKRGDIQLTTDPSFNTNDSKAFATSYSTWGGAGANSLFAFRVCDLQETTDPTVNSNDYKQLVSDLSKYAETPYNQYYRPLPTN